MIGKQSRKRTPSFSGWMKRRTVPVIRSTTSAYRASILLSHLFSLVGAGWNSYATWFIAFIISIHSWRIASKRIKVELKRYTDSQASKHLLSHRFGQSSMWIKNVHASHHTKAWKMCIRLRVHHNDDGGWKMHRIIIILWTSRIH